MVKSQRETPKSQTPTTKGRAEDSVVRLAEPYASALDRIFAAPDIISVQNAHARLLETFAPACYYDMIPGRLLGPVYVAVSERGLMAVDFGVSEAQFLTQLNRRFAGRVARSSKETADARRQIADYLAGKRTSFDLPIDWSGMSAFQRTVLEAALAIRRGQVKTYGEIARLIGRPQASRAVGRALGSNPMPLVIPCHRVLGADGSLHGYGAGDGLRTKARLLKFEGVAIAE